MIDWERAKKEGLVTNVGNKVTVLSTDINSRYRIVLVVHRVDKDIVVQCDPTGVTLDQVQYCFKHIPKRYKGTCYVFTDITGMIAMRQYADMPHGWKLIGEVEIDIEEGEGL